MDYGIYFLAGYYKYTSEGFSGVAGIDASYKGAACGGRRNNPLP